MHKKEDYIQKIIYILNYLKDYRDYQEKNIKPLNSFKRFVETIFTNLYNKEIKKAKIKAIRCGHSKNRAIPKVPEARLVRYCGEKIDDLNRVVEFREVEVYENPIGYKFVIDIKFKKTENVEAMLDGNSIYTNSSIRKIKEALYENLLVRKACGNNPSNIKIEKGETQFIRLDEEEGEKKPEDTLMITYLMPVSVEKISEINKKVSNRTLQEAISRTTIEDLNKIFKPEIRALVRGTLNYFNDNVMPYKITEKIEIIRQAINKKLAGQEGLELSVNSNGKLSDGLESSLGLIKLPLTEINEERKELFKKSDCYMTLKKEVKNAKINLADLIISNRGNLDIFVDYPKLSKSFTSIANQYKIKTGKNSSILFIK